MTDIRIVPAGHSRQWLPLRIAGSRQRRNRYGEYTPAQLSASLPIQQRPQSWTWWRWPNRAHRSGHGHGQGSAKRQSSAIEET